MKQRILLIEDEKAIYTSLARTLNGKGYEVVWTQTGHEALRRSLDESFNAVLLDLNVSDIDGMKALDFLGRLHPFLPVLILADPDELSEQSAVLAADALLRKPVKDTDLIQAVEEVLSESHHDRMSRTADALYGTITAP